MPTWDQTADIEEGNLSDFTATVGAVSATAGSKKNGSYGMNAVPSIVNAYGLLSGPVAEVRMTVEFWFDPNGFTGNTNDIVGALTVLTNAAFASLASVGCRKDASGYSLRCTGYTDAAVPSNGTYAAVTDDFHLLRLVWRASTAAGANNGAVLLYVDNVLVDQVTGIDSDTLVCEHVFYGTFSVSASIGGNVFFDDCRWANESEFIFFATGAISAISGSITKAGTKSLAGAISSIVGVIAKAGTKSLAGTIAMAGAIGRSFIPHVITAHAVARQRRPTVAYKPPEGGLGSIVEPLVLRNAAEPTNFLILRGYDDEQLSVRSQAQGRQLSVARVRRPAHARPSREDAE